MMRGRIVPPLPPRVTAFEDDDHAQPFVLHPFLKVTQPYLKLVQLFLVPLSASWDSHPTASEGIAPCRIAPSAAGPR